MPSAASTAATVFVLSDRDASAADCIRAHLAARGYSDARWFDTRDVNDLEDAAGAQAGPAVVVATLDSLTALLWDGALRTSFWCSPPARVELVGTTGTIDPQVSAILVRQLIAAWERHLAGRHRTRLVAGVCLSLIAIAAAFAIVALGT